MIRFLLALMPLLPLLAHAALPFAVDGQKLPSLAPMLDNTTPAVVNISTTTSRTQLRDHPLLNDPFFGWFFDAPRQRKQIRKSQSLGSGVIVDAERGYVITNHHVIDKAEQIQVTLKDGRKLEAQLLGKDAEMDVAVLQVQADGLGEIRFTDSEQLRVGDFVVAIGSPFGLNQTVTSGIVSALGRSGLGIEGYENFIQTDASINPGNSGGPLVNLRGELVGINTAILAPSGGNVGIGFAIPANMVKAIMRQIVEYGGVDRGVFGVSLQDLTPELAQAMGFEQIKGAMVTKVEKSSAAEEAGIRTGDVIVGINKHRVSGAGDLHTQLGLTRVNEHIALELIRNGKRRLINAQIADPYEHYTDGAKVSALFEGALLNSVIDRSHLGENAGISIGKIQPGSPASRLAIQPGDVLFHINRRRVKALSDLSEAIHNQPGIWQLKLRRGSQLLTLRSR